MKFLLDVNASGSLARWLSERGHNVTLVKDLDPKMWDDTILELAIREERIIVTTGQDFEEKIWRENKPHAGVLRLENLPRVERLSLVEYVLKHHANDLLSGAVVIATSRKIRVRRKTG